MPNTLFLYLEAPLQSWGERAQWSERDTAPEPTKSGIVGLLACALGWVDDARIRDLSQAIRVGVRCDRIGSPMTLMDYHTVGGGYATPQLLTGAGKPKTMPNSKTPHTEPTQRYYLSDAAFLVAVQAAPECVQQLAEAVQSPVWPMFLGRKACVPTRPPFEGTGDYDSLEHALRAWPAQTQQKRKPNLPFRAVIECSAGKEGSLRRRDEIALPSLRVFESRYSRETWLKDIPHRDLFAEAEKLDTHNS
jgi:CRISPR system Cascade subunit CasD